jgi:Protein of unknown function (DUF1588)/Protein of unknown function (DUF1592)/Protein of unknown function (DUF1585)/Protein of unknown function (DUF1595)
MFDTRRARIIAALSVAIVVAAGLLLMSQLRSHEQSAALQQPPVVRLLRVSRGQYQQSIKDIFGSAIAMTSILTDTERRSHGLLVVGDTEVSVTSSGFEAADTLAQSIARQVTAPENRGTLLPCHPASEQAADDACAQQFLSRMGRLLFRRGLTEKEVALQVSIAHAAALQSHDFYNGLTISLETLLTAPDFLFRVEVATPDPRHADTYRLTAYSKAARLSALLWNSSPDDQLLSAAERGELDSKKGLRLQTDRMLASPKLENGVRAFFSDMLEFDKFDALDKDPKIYSRFTADIQADIREQALRVLTDELVTKKADFREIFSTRETFLTPRLAALLDVVLSEGLQNDEPDKWVRYEYPAGDPRAGFLALPAFTALNSHPGASSPTLRGKAVRQDLMCQTVPPPPPNVDFSGFNNPATAPTARDRLKAHATNPVCAGCHKIMDPVGLAFEDFDGSGRWRTTEQGQRIDTRGVFEGRSYDDAAGLSQLLSNNTAVESCLINRVYSYGVARPLTAQDRATTDAFRKQFDKSGHQLPALLRVIASSSEFYQLDAPKAQVAATANSAAVLSAATNGESR